MKITVLGNFWCNGVNGLKGNVLTQEQVDEILSHKDELLSQKLILIEEHAPPAEEPKENEGLIDLGPGHDEEEPGADISASSSSEEEEIVPAGNAAPVKPAKLARKKR